MRKRFKGQKEPHWEGRSRMGLGHDDDG